MDLWEIDECGSLLYRICLLLTYSQEKLQKTIADSFLQFECKHVAGICDVIGHRVISEAYASQKPSDSILGNGTSAKSKQWSRGPTHRHCVWYLAKAHGLEAAKEYHVCLLRYRVPRREAIRPEPPDIFQFESIFMCITNELGSWHHNCLCWIISLSWRSSNGKRFLKYRIDVCCD